MADKYAGRIKLLERRRRKALRERRRALQRRRAALLRGQWSDARSALRVARRKAKVAQNARRNIRVLRQARKKANALARIARHRRKVWSNAGVSWYDGRQVASWLVPYLVWARKNGWRGYLVSGWRDPVYSERLCLSMCGRPSCSGRCAGRSSNHSGSVKPKGAVDVSDYYRFGAVIRGCPYSPRIFNGLGARDPVHFSAQGN